MIVILCGAPGAGKGTQADYLSQRLGFHKISTGDALRRHIKEGTEIGNQARALMAEGRLVPDEVLSRVLGAEFNSVRGKKILLDGYPRNVAQAKALDAILAPGEIKAVVHLDVGFEVLVGRISGRRTCLNCGASYHISVNPSRNDGVCDKCGSDIVQRPDDTEDKVQVRLGIYEEQTKPVLEYYKKQGLYVRIDGDRDVEDVYKGIAEKLEH